MAQSTCSIEGCNSRVSARGLCAIHYQSERRAGRLTPLPQRTPVERFWSKVDRRGPSECWLWLPPAQRDGYGQFVPTPKKPQRAHRYSYELHFGPIPPRMWVLHRCDTPLCVNPAHLFTGSPSDNARDMVAKGRHRNQRSHCKRGHEFVAENTILLKNGTRRCRACDRMRAAEFHRRHRLGVK